MVPADSVPNAQDYGNAIIFDTLPGTDKRGTFVAVNMTKVQAETDRWVAERSRAMAEGTLSGGDADYPTDDEMRGATEAAFENPANWMGEGDVPADSDEIGFFEMDSATGQIIGQA
jgi:hypothetical protein